MTISTWNWVICLMHVSQRSLPVILVEVCHSGSNMNITEDFRKSSQQHHGMEPDLKLD